MTTDPKDLLPMLRAMYPSHTDDELIGGIRRNSLPFSQPVVERAFSWHLADRAQHAAEAVADTARDRDGLLEILAEVSVTFDHTGEKCGCPRCVAVQSLTDRTLPKTIGQHIADGVKA
jgi:hypothetical protein